MPLLEASALTSPNMLENEEGIGVHVFPKSALLRLEEDTAERPPPSYSSPAGGDERPPPPSGGGARGGFSRCSLPFFSRLAWRAPADEESDWASGTGAPATRASSKPPSLAGMPTLSGEESSPLFCLIFIQM